MLYKFLSPRNTLLFIQIQREWPSFKVPRCLPFPEAKDGIKPSLQDLQSNTFPLCYLAKAPTSCAKVKWLFFLPWTFKIRDDQLKEGRVIERGGRKKRSFFHPWVSPRYAKAGWSQRMADDDRERSDWLSKEWWLG